VAHMDQAKMYRIVAKKLKRESANTYRDAVYATAASAIQKQNELKRLITRPLPGVVVRDTSQDKKPEQGPESPPVRMQTLRVCANEQSSQFVSVLATALLPNYASLVKCV